MLKKAQIILHRTDKYIYKPLISTFIVNTSTIVINEIVRTNVPVQNPKLAIKIMVESILVFFNAQPKTVVGNQVTTSIALNLSAEHYSAHQYYVAFVHSLMPTIMRTEPIFQLCVLQFTVKKNNKLQRRPELRSQLPG